MRKSRFTEAEVVRAVKQVESGPPGRLRASMALAERPRTYGSRGLCDPGAQTVQARSASSSGVALQGQGTPDTTRLVPVAEGAFLCLAQPWVPPADDAPAAQEIGFRPYARAQHLSREKEPMVHTKRLKRRAAELRVKLPPGVKVGKSRSIDFVRDQLADGGCFCILVAEGYGGRVRLDYREQCTKHRGGSVATLASHPVCSCAIESEAEPPLGRACQTRCPFMNSRDTAVAWGSAMLSAEGELLSCTCV